MLISIQLSYKDQSIIMNAKVEKFLNDFEYKLRDKFRYTNFGSEFIKSFDNENVIGKCWIIDIDKKKFNSLKQIKVVDHNTWTIYVPWNIYVPAEIEMTVTNLEKIGQEDQNDLFLTNFQYLMLSILLAILLIVFSLIPSYVLLCITWSLPGREVGTKCVSWLLTMVTCWGIYLPKVFNKRYMAEEETIKNIPAMNYGMQKFGYKFILILSFPIYLPLITAAIGFILTLLLLIFYGGARVTYEVGRGLI